MESDATLLKSDAFPASFHRQDVRQLPSFQRWEEVKKKEGKKIVKCPICFGYETFEEPTNHICKNCGEEYCQQCLKKIVEDEVQHDHYGCCKKFCNLMRVIYSFGKNTQWREPKLYVYTTLLFLFGTPLMFSIKYFKFFLKNKATEGAWAHWLFTFMNLIANICYSIIYHMIFFEISFIIFLPGIFCWPYFKTIMNNWMVVYEYDVDECPITELTVCGRGYAYY